MSDRPTDLLGVPLTDQPVEIDLAAYVREHGCYPPEGVGRLGDLDRWLGGHQGDGFSRWAVVDGVLERLDLPPGEGEILSRGLAFMARARADRRRAPR